MTHAPNVFLFDLAPNAQGRIQLARTGSFYRHDQGNFKVSKAMLETMRDNAVERGVDVPILLTHEGRTFAVGWVKPASLSVQPWGSFYGLFGVPTWSDEEIKNAGQQNKLKYTSPEIVWNDRRMADSPRGKAGEPIGPTLCAIALVLDPFFTMDPVVFGRLTPLPTPRRQAKEFSMLTSEQIREALTKAEVPEANLDKAVLGIIDLQMAGAPAPEPAEPPMDAAASDPMPDPQAQYSKDPVVAALQRQTEVQARELANLKKTQEAQAKLKKDELYASYSKAGKLRYADAKEARALLDGDNGERNFVAAYGRVPELTNQAAPAGPKDNKSTAAPETTEQTTPARRGRLPVMNVEADAKIQKYAAENKVDYITAAIHYSRNPTL